jgi:hypothetical protein
MVSLRPVLATLALAVASFALSVPVFVPSASAATVHRRVAVWRVEFPGGGMAANNEEFLRRSLMEGLANADFQVFGGLTVTQLLKQGSRLESCREESCYQEIARSLGVEYLVTGTITVDRKNYDITLELINGRDGKLIDRYTEPCQLCGIKEVGTKLDQLVQAVRRGADSAAATAPARYSVESRPAGAEVSVDGKVAGLTPLSVDLSAGQHKVGIRSLGYEVSERTLNVESGTNGVVTVDLAPMGGVTGGRARPVRMLAWTSIAVGLVAVGVGAVALSYNNRYLGCDDAVPPPSEAQCMLRRVQPTELEAGVLFGAGGVLFLGGATTLFLTPSDPPGMASNPGSIASRGWVGGIQGKF